MRYVVQYDKMVAENTWLEGLRRAFRYEAEAAKFGRALKKSQDHTNIRVYEKR